MSNSIHWSSSSLPDSFSSDSPSAQPSTAPSNSSDSSDSSTKHPIRRVTHACDFCSYRKRRCDGAQPCANCVRRGRACEYARPIYKRGPHHSNGLEKEKTAKKERRMSVSSASDDGEGVGDIPEQEYKEKLKTHHERQRSPLIVDAVSQQHSHLSSLHSQPNGQSNLTVPEGDRNAMEEEAVALTLALTLPTRKNSQVLVGNPSSTINSNSQSYSSTLLPLGKVNKSYTAPLPLTNSSSGFSAPAALIPACSSTSALPLCTPAPTKLSTRLPLPISASEVAHLSPPSSSSTYSLSPSLGAVQLSTPTHFSGTTLSPAPTTPTPPSIHTSPAQSPSSSSSTSSPPSVTPSQSSPPPLAMSSPNSRGVGLTSQMAGSPKKRKREDLMAELRNCVVAADSHMQGPVQKGSVNQGGGVEEMGQQETIRAAIQCIQRLVHMKGQGRTVQHNHTHIQVYPPAVPPAALVPTPVAVPVSVQVSPPVPHSYPYPTLIQPASFPPPSSARVCHPMFGNPLHSASFSHCLGGVQNGMMVAQQRYVQPLSEEDWWYEGERGLAEVGEDIQLQAKRAVNVHTVDEETEDEKEQATIEEVEKKRKQQRLHHDMNRHRGTNMEVAMSECG